MARIFHFMRSDLLLSLAGGFALGFAGIALVKPASATQEKDESRAVLVEATAQGAITHGKLSR
jgi:hypothetical protein